MPLCIHIEVYAYFVLSNLRPPKLQGDKGDICCNDDKSKWLTQRQYQSISSSITRHPITKYGLSNLSSFVIPCLYNTQVIIMYMSMKIASDHICNSRTATAEWVHHSLFTNADIVLSNLGPPKLQGDKGRICCKDDKSKWLTQGQYQSTFSSITRRSTTSNPFCIMLRDIV